MYTRCDPYLGKDLSHKSVDLNIYPRSDAYLVCGTKTNVYIDAAQRIHYLVFIAEMYVPKSIYFARERLGVLVSFLQ